MFGLYKKKYDLGIVLGGGGARGFAHLGVLEALKKKGIEPDIISGVSAGAIAGAFIASGKTPRQALEIIREYKFFDISKLQLPRMSLFSLKAIRDSIEKEIPQKSIEDLGIPLVVAATNMYSGKVEYFSEGPLSKIVQASSSIPVVFNPIEINGALYSDGGVFDNLPIEPLKGLCKKIIVVNISPIQQVEELKNIAQIAARMFELSVNARHLEKSKKSDLYIEPPGLRKFDILDTKHAQEIFDIGYNYTRELLG
jgi:NTE family protein